MEDLPIESENILHKKFSILPQKTISQWKVHDLSKKCNMLPWKRPILAHKYFGEKKRHFYMNDLLFVWNHERGKDFLAWQKVVQMSSPLPDERSHLTKVIQEECAVSKAFRQIVSQNRPFFSLYLVGTFVLCTASTKGSIFVHWLDFFFF